MTGEKKRSMGSETLKPVEQPPNHHGMDLSELPPMREADLSLENVNSLIHDIKCLATDIQLLQHKPGSPRANASHARTAKELDLAQLALTTGKIERIQIRYCWQESNWIDTLSVQAGGYRLVRIAHKPNSTP